jgi:hypothetical protein
LTGFVSTAHAQTIPTGPLADPYWRQFVPQQNAVQLDPVSSGIESDPYWRQFLPKEYVSAQIDSVEANLVGGPELDPYWSQFLPRQDAAVAAHRSAGPDTGLATKSNK